VDRSIVVDVIIRHVSHLSGMPASDISEASRLDDLPIDSMDCILLVVALEDDLGIEIGCGDRVTLETVGDIADLAQTRTRAAMPLAA
jgi:acyl carrier protein